MKLLRIIANGLSLFKENLKFHNTMTNALRKVLFQCIILNNRDKRQMYRRQKVAMDINSKGAC